RSAGRALRAWTGRSAQLRGHCAAAGWSIVGDAIYGTSPRSGGPALHLHAREIVVPLYKNREPIRGHDPDRLAVLVERHHDLARMQMQRGPPAARRGAVDRIADDRPARGGAVPAQLGAAPGPRPECTAGAA